METPKHNYIYMGVRVRLHPCHPSYGLFGTSTINWHMIQWINWVWFDNRIAIQFYECESSLNTARRFKFWPVSWSSRGICAPKLYESAGERGKKSLPDSLHRHRLVQTHTPTTSDIRDSRAAKALGNCRECIDSWSTARGMPSILKESRSCPDSVCCHLICNWALLWVTHSFCWYRRCWGNLNIYHLHKLPVGYSPRCPVTARLFWQFYTLTSTIHTHSLKKKHTQFIWACRHFREPGIPSVILALEGHAQDWVWAASGTQA